MDITTEYFVRPQTTKKTTKDQQKYNNSINLQ